MAQLSSVWLQRPVLAQRGICETFLLQYPSDIKPDEGELFLRSALEGHGLRLINRDRTSVIVRKEGRPPSGPCRPEYGDVRTKFIRANAQTLDYVRDEAEKARSEKGILDVLKSSNSLIFTDHSMAIHEMEGWIGN